jgi:hypothetical protein
VPTRRTAALALLPCALLGAQPVAAQAADAAREAPEEVIVRGRRLADFRAELEAAQLRVYDLFNELNSDDAFDVRCQTEDATGTRLRQQTCRPRFVDDISSAAAVAWVNGLKDACGVDGLTQECIFDNPRAASQAKSVALGEEGREPTMQKRFAAEMARVVRDHPEMQQALLDYEAVELAYDEASDGRRRGVREDAR